MRFLERLDDNWEVGGALPNGLDRRSSAFSAARRRSPSGHASSQDSECRTIDMITKAEALVLGAGPAGLGAAISLGRCATVLEANLAVGGLCRSLEINGAIFDLGGHSFHTPHQEVKDLVFDTIEMETQQRSAGCFVQGQLIPYPFQENFKELRDKETVAECAAGLDLADQGVGSVNLGEFILRRFGPGIARHFLEPYNRKLWKRDLSQLTADWVGERIATSENSPASPHPLPGRRLPLMRNELVAYPSQGGFGRIFEALAAKVHDLRLGHEVAQIDLNRRKVVTTCGRSFGWQHLISSIPLPKLLRCIHGVPRGLAAEVEGLESLRLVLALSVSKNSCATPIQRVYSAEDGILGHKFAICRNSSSFLRALPNQGILTEMSIHPSESMDEVSMRARVAQDLGRVNLVKDPAEVLSVTFVDLPYGYPVPTHDRARVVERARAWLAEYNVHLVGRFAEWAYINSDEALMRGLLLGQRLG